MDQGPDREFERYGVKGWTFYPHPNVGGVSGDPPNLVDYVDFPTRVPGRESCRFRVLSHSSKRE